MIGVVGVGGKTWGCAVISGIIPAVDVVGVGGKTWGCAVISGSIPAVDRVMQAIAGTGAAICGVAGRVFAISCGRTYGTTAIGCVAGLGAGRHTTGGG